jgi:fatty acid desaturase
MGNPLRRVEWPTLAMIGLCYLIWIAALFLPIPVTLQILLAAVAIALHSSLTHEVIHGHPTRWRSLNEALVWPALALVVPYGRFRDTHLDHHYDARLTDPYDDPESNYFDPVVWARLPAAAQWVLGLNNTLLGRIVLGPFLGTLAFLASDFRAMRAGDGRVWRSWLWHIPSAIAVVLLLRIAPISGWAYLASLWLGLGLIKIRTFLEHQAHELVPGRTAVVEDRGPLSLLFLNNNLHFVHHMHPSVAWYDLPVLYAARRETYLARNGGYLFRSYGEVFARYLVRAKDPVPHPLWSGRRD